MSDIEKAERLGRKRARLLVIVGLMLPLLTVIGAIVYGLLLSMLSPDSLRMFIGRFMKPR